MPVNALLRKIRMLSNAPPVAIPTSIGFVDTTARPVAAAMQIDGQVRAGDGTIAGSTVSLRAARVDAPMQLAQRRTQVARLQGFSPVSTTAMATQPIPLHISIRHVAPAQR